MDLNEDLLYLMCEKLPPRDVISLANSSKYYYNALKGLKALDHANYRKKGMINLINENNIDGVIYLLNTKYKNGKCNGEFIRTSVRYGNLDMVKLFAPHTDLISIKLAFYEACACGSIEIVKYFIEHTDYIDNKIIGKAVFDAIYFEQYQIILYLDKYIDDNLDDYMNDSIVGGNLDIIKYFISKGAKITNKKLRYLSKCDNTLVLDYFIQNHNIDITYEENAFFLMLCVEDNIEMIKRVLELNPDEITTEFINLVAIIVTINSDNINTLKYLITLEGVYLPHRIDVLRLACTNGSMEIVKYVMECGILMDQEALSNACLMGHIDIVRYLLQTNCVGLEKYDITDNDNEPVLNAVNSGSLELVIYLLSLEEDGKKIIDPSFNNNEMLIAACIQGYLDIVIWLHAIGIDIHFDNNIAMQTAIENDNPNVARYILQKI